MTMEAKTAGALVPLATDRFVRSLPAAPRRQRGLATHRAVLEPARHLLVTDVADYRLGRYGTARELDAAVELLAGPLRGIDRKALPPLARLLVEAMTRVNAAAPMPFAEAADLALVRRESGLLEAAVARIAERAAVHGSITEASLSESFGEAGAALWRAFRSAVPERRGLAWLLERARLPVVPRDLDLPPTGAELDACVREDPTLVPALLGASSIPEQLPVTAAAASLIEPGTFAGMFAVCVQHVLGTQVASFTALAEKGLAPARVEIIGVPYSTNYVTQLALARRGFAVHTPPLAPGADIEAVVDAALRVALRRALERARGDERILVMDDGGKAVRAIHAELAAEAHRFTIAEQTTRGITETGGLTSALRVPVIDVARSALKRHESETIGREIADAVDVWLARLSMPAMSRRRALVIGYGMIGSGVARALAARGALVTVFDATAGRRAEAAQAGFEVQERLDFAGRQLVLGCTGHRTLGFEEVSRLDDGTVIASASSRQIEIDMRIPERPGVSAQVIANAGPGDDRYLTWLWRLGERNVVVLSNGFPLNFTGAVETGMRESIQKTRALMLLGAAQAARTTTPGLHPLSREVQERLRQLVGDVW